MVASKSSPRGSRPPALANFSRSTIGAGTSSADTYCGFIAAICMASDVLPVEVRPAITIMSPLRLALTGREHGPELKHLLLETPLVLSVQFIFSSGKRLPVVLQIPLPLQFEFVLFGLERLLLRQLIEPLLAAQVQPPRGRRVAQVHQLLGVLLLLLLVGDAGPTFPAPSIARR